MLRTKKRLGLHPSKPLPTIVEEREDTIPEYLSFSAVWDYNESLIFAKNMVVTQNFISAEEEESLVHEIRCDLSVMPYGLSNKDYAVCGYRQAKKEWWSIRNRTVIYRAISHGFPETRMTYPTGHVIELCHHGCILPHVSCSRCPGDIIVGINLQSASIMRMVNLYDPGRVVDVLMPERSLYTMQKTARYDYTHAILKPRHSYFKGLPVRRTGRMSIVLSSHLT